VSAYGIKFLAGIDTKASDKLAVRYSAFHLDRVIITMRGAQAPVQEFAASSEIRPAFLRCSACLRWGRFAI